MGSILRILALFGIVIVLETAGIKISDWHLWVVVGLAVAYGFVFNKR
jgi:hypothetical protein